LHLPGGLDVQWLLASSGWRRHDRRQVQEVGRRKHHQSVPPGWNSDWFLGLHVGQLHKRVGHVREWRCANMRYHSDPSGFVRLVLERGFLVPASLCGFLRNSDQRMVRY